MGILRELYRRWQAARHQPGHWRLRPGTLDRRIFLDVVVRNEYRLPDHLTAADVVLDVGAHVGSFTLAALRCGAGRVLACEPFADNYRLLEHNLSPYGDRVTLLNRAVWRSGTTPQELSLGNPLDARNTGAPRIGAGGTDRVLSIGLDDLVQLAGGRVRLVKLDCEGAEWPALLTATRLDAVQELCGEYHLGEFSAALHSPDLPPFTLEVLREFLGQAGFEVELRPDPRSPFPVGLFFARRGQGG